MIKLSIIIPVFGVEDFVGKTLDSIFETSAPADVFEVIVVNDGTKDRSMDVVRRFADRLNLRIFEQENQGLSAARNHGLENAEGEYVWFIDSDDCLVDDGVGKVLDLLAEKPGTDVLMFPLKWVYEDGTKDHLDYGIQEEKGMPGKMVLRDSGLPAWAAARYVFKRSLTGNRFLSFPEGLLHEDEYFGPALLYLAETVCVMKDPVYQYRIRSGSIMSSRTARSWYDMVSIHKEVIRFMKHNVAPEDFGWFRTYRFRLLLSIYQKNVSVYETPEFIRFARTEGFYVWRQWLKVYPEKTLRNKLGRLLFFLLPAEKQRLAGAK